MARLQASDTPGLAERKQSHLDLCANEEVEYPGRTTLFGEVDLLHNALPELALDEIDVGVGFLGKQLRAPLLITGMTGGTDDAFAVNRDLAQVAEQCGIAFGLGSQRVMQDEPSSASTFAVRPFAPSVVLLANLGLNQAVRQSSQTIRALVDSVGADGLCLHLNPAQELIQREGDRDFRGGYAALKRLCSELPIPIIAKETGCGVSRTVGTALRDAGVRYVDVSGAGGTSWVRVEMLRGDERSRALGDTFSNWGIPTAASLLMLDGLGLQLIASGGLRTGLEMAKAIALGARLCGVALPIYRAYRSGGIDAARALIEQLVAELKTAMLLTGAHALADLARQPVIIGERLQTWVRAARAPYGADRR